MTPAANITQPTHKGLFTPGKRASPKTKKPKGVHHLGFWIGGEGGSEPNDVESMFPKLHHVAALCWLFSYALATRLNMTQIQKRHRRWSSAVQELSADRRPLM